MDTIYMTYFIQAMQNLCAKYYDSINSQVVLFYIVLFACGLISNMMIFSQVTRETGDYLL